MRLNYKVSHKTSKSEDSGILSNFVQISIPPTLQDGTRNPARVYLSDMLETDGNTTNPVLLMEILPKFLKVTNNGIVKPVGSLMDHIGPGEWVLENDFRLFYPDTKLLDCLISFYVG